MTEQKSFETWAIVVDFDGTYEVSSIGRVRRVGTAHKSGNGHGGGARVGHLNIRRAQQKYPGLEIDGVDEEVFLGLCEDCGKALFPQDEYVCDDDGIKWCKRHDSVLED